MKNLLKKRRRNVLLVPKQEFILAILITFFTISFSHAEATLHRDYYVTSNNLNVRLAPNKAGKITNMLYKRQKVKVFQVKDEWARISRYYDGEVEGLSGKVAHWVFTKYLSTSYPMEEQVANLNSPIVKAIKSSNDFSKYQSIFISASEKLIKSGKCSLGDFKEMGGWCKSTTHKLKPIYFIYCGGMTKNNRIYLNTTTGKTFRRKPNK